MSDESFGDSFDSESDSDHVDGTESYPPPMLGTNFSSISGSGGMTSIHEIPLPRRDLLLMSGNGGSDHEDWR